MLQANLIPEFRRKVYVMFVYSILGSSVMLEAIYTHGLPNYLQSIHMGYPITYNHQIKLYIYWCTGKLIPFVVHFSPLSHYANINIWA
jgi:hypothetical protein